MGKSSPNRVGKERREIQKRNFMGVCVCGGRSVNKNEGELQTGRR